MAYLESRIVDNAFIDHQNRTFLTPFLGAKAPLGSLDVKVKIKVKDEATKA